MLCVYTVCVYCVCILCVLCVCNLCECVCACPCMYTVYVCDPITKSYVSLCVPPTAMSCYLYIVKYEFPLVIQAFLGVDNPSR